MSFIVLEDRHGLTATRVYFLSRDAKYAHLDDAGRWAEAERQLAEERQEGSVWRGGQQNLIDAMVHDIEAARTACPTPRPST